MRAIRFCPCELVLNDVRKQYAGWKITLSISSIVNRTMKMAETVISHFLSFPLISFIPLFCGSDKQFIS